jgi:membrane-associated phospholipid phosphatase
MTPQLGNHWTNLSVVLCSVLALSVLITNPAIHSAINNWEANLTIAANSIVGMHPSLDRLLGWLNTRIGDLLVISLMAGIFTAHSFGASTFNVLVERLSFWGWVATLCISTYLLVCATEHLYCHPIPVQALPQLHDVRTMYGIPVHASAFNSFPSGHGLAYIFFALMAWCKRYRRMSLFLILFGTIMLATRVVLGMHWLSDIFLGALPLSLVLSSVALRTPLKQSFRSFYSITYFLLARLSGHAWTQILFNSSQYS